MEDRVFSVIGFGYHCESMANLLNSEGIGLGWDRDTRLLIILLDNNDSDTFIIRLCKKVKEKRCRTVVLTFNPYLDIEELQKVVDSILFNENEREVLTIIRTLRDVIYQHNIWCYDMNDVICFLKSFKTGKCSFQEYHFTGLNLSDIGEGILEFEYIPTKRFLTLMRFCQPVDGNIYTEMDFVCKEIGSFPICSGVVDNSLPFSTLDIITITQNI